VDAPARTGAHAGTRSRARCRRGEASGARLLLQRAAGLLVGCWLGFFMSYLWGEIPRVISAPVILPQAGVSLGAVDRKANPGRRGMWRGFCPSKAAVGLALAVSPRVTLLWWELSRWQRCFLPGVAGRGPGDHTCPWASSSPR